MSRNVELQPWTVLRGAYSYYEIIQETPDWVNTSGHDIGTVTIEVPELTNAKFYLEGCDDSGGSFTSIKTVSAVSTTAYVGNMLRMMPMGSPGRLYSHLRWRVLPTDDDWSVTFRVNTVLK